MKVFNGSLFIKNSEQVAACVAAKNMAEAARLTGLPVGQIKKYWSVTKNEKQCAVALAQPGVVLIRKLYDWDGEWKPKP